MGKVVRRGKKYYWGEFCLSVQAAFDKKKITQTPFFGTGTCADQDSVLTITAVVSFVAFYSFLQILQPEDVDKFVEVIEKEKEAEAERKKKEKATGSAKQKLIDSTVFSLASDSLGTLPTYAAVDNSVLDLSVTIPSPLGKAGFFSKQHREFDVRLKF